MITTIVEIQYQSGIDCVAMHGNGSRVSDMLVIVVSLVSNLASC